MDLFSKKNVSIAAGAFATYVVFAVCAMHYHWFDRSDSLKAQVLSSIDLSKAYGPQLDRNAEFDGHRTAAMTDQQINSLSKNVGYEVINKPHADFDLEQHFIDAARLSQAAQARGNQIRIMEYYGMAYWFLDNFHTDTHAGWGTYASTFNDEWYLKDADGAVIPIFNGASPRQKIGYMLDLANPEYRAWAIATIMDWMSQAPYHGIAFDNTNVLYGTNPVLPLVRSDKITSNQTWNYVLCGSDQEGDCDRVRAWNDGLIALLQTAQAQLHARGMEVFYNGVAATDSRGASRNTGLLQYTDGAYNEDFCYHLDGDIVFKPFSDDVDMMLQQATAGKKMFEITNHRSDPEKLALGPYCLAGFLMGWQPGYGYWIYHRDYTDPLADPYPAIAEQNLNLGNPTAHYAQSGTILSRTFQNGFVAVNTGDAAQSAVLPAAMIEFKGGIALGEYKKGESVSLAPRTGRFFLTKAFIDPEAPPVEPPPEEAPPAEEDTDTSSSTSSHTSTTIGTAGPVYPVNTPIAGTETAADQSFDAPVSNVVHITATQPKPTPLPSSTPTKPTAPASIPQPSTNTTITSIDYILDATTVHTATAFPDTFTLDTNTLSNDWHTLSTVYHHADGSTTESIKFFKVENNKTIIEKLTDGTIRIWNSIRALVQGWF